MPKEKMVMKAPKHWELKMETGTNGRWEEEKLARQVKMLVICSIVRIDGE